MSLLNFQTVCKEFARKVDDLVGHDLPPEQASRFLEHARVCERCAKEWRAALERAAALQSLTPWALEAAGVRPPEPGSTADAVFARLNAGEGLPTLGEQWRRPAMAIAATLLLGVAGVYSSSVLFKSGNVINNSGAGSQQDAIAAAGVSSGAAPVVNVNLTNDGELRSDERVVDPWRRKMLLESSMPEENRSLKFGPIFVNYPNQVGSGPMAPNRSGSVVKSASRPVIQDGVASRPFVEKF